MAAIEILEQPLTAAAESVDTVEDAACVEEGLVLSSIIAGRLIHFLKTALHVVVTDLLIE